MLTAAAIVAVGAGGAAAGGAVAGGYVLYSKHKKKKKMNKQGKTVAKEMEKHEELEEKDIQELLTLKKNDKYVQYELGLKTENEQDSAKYMRAASSQGHALAAYELGVRYLSGVYTPQSEDMALDFFVCAAGRGLEKSMIAAGDIHFKNEQWKDAKKFYKKAEDLGSEEGAKKLAITKLQTAEPDLQCQYAKSLEASDMKDAAHWYEKAANQNHAESAYRLGKMYLEGYGTENSEDKALMLLLQASGSGHQDASILLAETYEKKGMLDEALEKLLPCNKTPQVKAKIDELQAKINN